MTRSDTVRCAASLALLAGLLAALLPGRSAPIAGGIAALGLALTLAQLTPGALRLLMRHGSLVAVIPLAALAVVWIVLVHGAVDRSVVTTSAGAPSPAVAVLLGGPRGRVPWSWSWPFGTASPLLLLLAFVVVCGGGALALISDAVRLQVGQARGRRSMWRAITATPTHPGRIAARAVPGLALLALLAAVCVILVRGYAASVEDSLTGTLGILATVLLVTLLLACPVVIGLAMQVDLDQAGQARDRERERFAAYLHDSVLQTLALIQRQSTDATTVSRLARRQEHALRAWMAGEAELSSETFVGALRDMVSEIEDDHGMTVEVTTVGDGRLDDPGRQMIAAGREALRNVGRHASGARVNVFLDVDPTRSEMYIRDDGPGFDILGVPVERRGLRDSVVGRMMRAGGEAIVESRLGEGTEIVLRLPREQSRR